MLQEEGEFCRSPLLPQFPCGKGENRPCLTLRSSNIKKFRGGEGPRGGREMETHPDEPGAGRGTQPGAAPGTQHIPGHPVRGDGCWVAGTGP